MKYRIRRSCLAAVVGIAGTCLFARSACANGPPDWWEAKREVTAALSEPGAGYAALVAQARAMEPTTGQEGMFKLQVFMRAVMTPEAIDVLRELKQLCPDLRASGPQAIYHDACGRLEAWQIAQHVLEIFADNVSEVDVANRLAKHWLRSGWTVDQIDQWLAARGPGRDSCWIKQRLRFNGEHGRSDSLIRQLAEQVKQNPQDMDGAVAFLDVLNLALQGRAREQLDLAWMQQAIKPTEAIDASRLATRLEQLGKWPEATAFYQQAIELPLTDEQLRRHARPRQRPITMQQRRVYFAMRVREALAECLTHLGEADAAQAYIVEAADLREEHGLQRNAYLAGRVQDLSGQREIERRIREQEGKSRDDPQYWLERAAYYRGRKQP